jgi:Tfp pilus assembly protein PilF
MEEKSTDKKVPGAHQESRSDLMQDNILSLRDHRLTLAISLLLLVCTLSIYWQLINHDFINFDDDQYVTENAQVQYGLTLQGLQWAFTTTYTTNWHPLTWLSHMLDVELYDMNPAGHHMTGLLLHLLNTLLLFLLLKKLTGLHWRSAFVAMLFAIHPLHVESVAWVAERKDVLSTFFWMLTIWFYADYVHKGKAVKYWIALFAFALGLMSKPMVVTLPFVLLLLDYWPLSRFSLDAALQRRTEVRATLIRLLVEKLPFFLLTAISATITVMIGDVQSVQDFSIEDRIGNALVSYVAYISNMFWPYPLVIFRPHPGGLPIWQPVVALLFILAVTLLVIVRGKKRPYLPVGWFLYLGALVPVIGLIQVGLQSRADRYTYVPLIGIAIMLVWGIGDLAKKWKQRRGVLAGGMAVITLLLMLCTYNQVGYFKNSITVFEHAIKHEPDAYYSRNNLALAYQDAGNLDKAIEHFEEAIRLKPDRYKYYNNLGAAYFRKGKYDEAVKNYLIVLARMPGNIDARNNLGNIYQVKGQYDLAIQQYELALSGAPDNAVTLNNMGMAYIKKREIDKAVVYLKKAVDALPGYTLARVNLGRAFGEQGDIDTAIAHFLLALEMAPNDPMVHNWLGLSYALKGKKEKAIHHYQLALKLNPNMPATRSRLEQLANQH